MAFSRAMYWRGGLACLVLLRVSAVTTGPLFPPGPRTDWRHAVVRQGAVGYLLLREKADCGCTEDAASPKLQAGLLRLSGGHRSTGFKRRNAKEKVRTSRRIHRSWPKSMLPIMHAQPAQSVYLYRYTNKAILYMYSMSSVYTHTSSHTQTMRSIRTHAHTHMQHGAPTQ